MLARCTTTACDALETVWQNGYLSPVHDVALAVQSNGRLALMAVLNDGSSFVHRCAATGCADGSGQPLPGSENARRISATVSQIGTPDPIELTIATTFGTNGLRITTCNTQDECTERFTMAGGGIEAISAVRAITGVDGNPLFGYWRGSMLAISRCQGTLCNDLAETVISTSIGAGGRARLSATVLGTGLPAFVPSRAGFNSTFVICTDGACVEPPRPINLEFGFASSATTAATVGPDGALRIIRQSTGISVRYGRCRDAVMCLPLSRPR